MASGCDLMISYHESDAEFVTYLKGELEKEGFSTWSIKVEDMNNKQEMAKKGNMIINCKVYLVVLSEDSVQSPEIKDEMSLAYISSKPLYPLARKWYPKIAKVMESGMKLMLAKINWTFFVKEPQYKDSLENLVQCLRNDIQSSQLAPSTQREDEKEEDEDEEDYSPRVEHMSHAPMGLFGNNTATQNPTTDPEDPESETVCEHTNKGIAGDFWNRHFDSKTEVAWTSIESAFLHDYKASIEEDFSAEKLTFFVKTLRKEIFEKHAVITRLQYNKFVGKHVDPNKDQFYERLRHYVSSSLALREVLDMNSTVRLATISNLGQFQTPGVITLLFDLVEDVDPNIRAVAGLSLAKTGKKSRRIEDKLLALLEDEDRVVRESACLSLAHMRCQRAVKHIVDLWRNDAIKHVREAAEIALTRIGGEEAEKAIKVTTILTSEMTNLRGGQS